MLKPLMELYASLFSEAGPKGKTLSASDLDAEFPDASVYFDRDVGQQHHGHASFRKDAGGNLIAALGKGGGHWEWKPAEERWIRIPGAPGAHDLHSFFGSRPGTREPGRTGAQIRPTDGYGADWDAVNAHFSKSEPEYKKTLTQAGSRIHGAGFMNVIDSVYGRGTADKAIKEMWKYLWTDVEALAELGHFFDVAQQAAGQKQVDRDPRNPGHPRFPAPPPWAAEAYRDAVARYPMRIGPRYDMPDDFEPEPGQAYDPSQFIRRQRRTDNAPPGGSFGNPEGMPI